MSITAEERQQVLDETIERYGADTTLLEATGKQVVTVQLQVDDRLQEVLAFARAAAAGDETVPVEMALQVALEALSDLRDWLVGSVVALNTTTQIADVGAMNVADFMAKVAELPDYDLLAEATKYGLVAESEATAEPQDDEQSESSD